MAVDVDGFMILSLGSDSSISFSFISPNFLPDSLAIKRVFGNLPFKGCVPNMVHSSIQLGLTYYGRCLSVVFSPETWREVIV